MRKKRFGLICMVVASCTLPALVRAQFTTTTNAGTVTITKYTGGGGSVTIPDTTNGLPITGIGSSAFSFTGVTHVTIGSNVTWIGNSAFYFCASLVGVSIGTNVACIGDMAFYYCPALTSLVIPGSVTNIGGNSFCLCESLKNVTIPNGVISIGAGAFDACSVLGNVTIPASVTNIGISAFADCPVLTTILVNASNAWYSSTNGVLFDKSQATLIEYPQGGAAAYTIPASVTSIGASAFQDCVSLTNLTIPDSVVSIGNNAFQDTGLANVWIPNGVVSIGDHAFEMCFALTSISIPASLTNMGDRVFYACNYLSAITVDVGNPAYSSQSGILFDKNRTTLIQYPPGINGLYTIPNSMTTIGDYAFAYCNGLTSITIPSSVTNIGDGAFQNCSELTSIAIPNGMVNIGDYTFQGCAALTSLIIPNSVIAIGTSAFSQCSALSSVNLPNSVTTIGDEAFFYCSSLKSITIPDSVTNMGNETFYSCASLAEVVLSDSITSIGYSVFQGCSALSSIVIPGRVTSIGMDAFDLCNGLTVAMISSNVSYISSGAFFHCSDLTHLYFTGNAPALADSSVFTGDSQAIAYYLAGTTGWGSTLGGIPTALFAPGAPVASPVTNATLQSVPLAIILPVTSTTVPFYQLICSVVQAPAHGTVTLQYPSLAPSNDTCFIWYTPTNGFIGTDTFTFVANDGTYNSNIATAKVAVIGETPPTVQPVQGRTTPGTSVQIPINYTQLALDAEQLTLTATIVASPGNGQASGGIFTPGEAPSLTYTPTSGFTGVDTFTFKLNDGVRDSNIGTATVEVLQPNQHATNQMVLLVVNNLLLPEITNQVTQLQSDLVAQGYSAAVVAWSNASGNALWNYLHTIYTNTLSTTTFLEGAMLIGNIPIEGLTDLSYWNLTTNVVSTSSSYGNAALGVPGPYQIWVSRFWGCNRMQNWGSEVTMTTRMLQSNHDYRTGASRLPQTAFAFDRAYGAEKNATAFNPPWPVTMELSLNGTDPVAATNHPLGCGEAFLRGGDLLAEESHGQGDLYTLNVAPASAPSGMLIDEPKLMHSLAQVRSVLNSSCEIGSLGSVVNAQLCTRAGGTLLSIGASQTTFSGAVIPGQGQIPLLATGMTWGDALIQCPLADNQYLIYYGDLSLPILNSPTSNAMPVVTLTASAAGRSFTAFSTNNYMGVAAPVLAGVQPFSVSFTNTASSPCNAIALAEWFPESYDFGRNTPDMTEIAPTSKTHTYPRAHRYLARLEVADTYKARAFAETEIRVAPQPGHPLRVICGLTADQSVSGGWNTIECPTLDYLSPTTGKLWLQDQAYASGTWGAQTFNYSGYGQDYSGPIAGTADAKIFQYSHYEGTQYTIPVSNGMYTVNMGFADVWSLAPGTRILDIYLNGQKTTTVDLFALAGKPATAVIVPVPVTVTSNLLTIAIHLNPASTVTNAAPSGTFSDGTWLNNFEILPAGYTNHPPVAGNVLAATSAGQATNVFVLAAASDPDGDEIILTGASTPANGSTVVSNSCVVYTPRTGFAGTDTFSYVVCDGNGGVATGTVTMAVTGLYGNSPIVSPQASPAIGPPPLAVSFTANATSPNGYPLTYAWSFGDGMASTNQNPVHSYTNGGVYTATLTASDPYGDTGIGQVTVVVTVPPAITQQPVSTGAGVGQATFTVTATGAPYPSYQWLCNGVAISGATNNAYTITNAGYANFGALYSVAVSNCVGVTNSQSATLYAGLVCFMPSTDMPPAGYDLDSGGSVNGALGYGWTVAQSAYNNGYHNTDARLNAFVDVGTNAAGWLYYVPNGVYDVTVSCGGGNGGSSPNLLLIQGATAINNAVLGNNQFAAVTNFQTSVTNGQLVLTVGGSSGKTYLNYSMIQRAPSLVTLSASATPTNGIMPLAVQFMSSGVESDGNPVSYSWSFGDGGTSTNQNPSYTYTNAGVYMATVMASSYGTTGNVNATSSVQIVVTSNLRTLTTATAGLGTGTVTLNPPGGIYLTGTVVAVTATAGTNSTFIGWSGAVTGTNNPVTLLMNSNYAVTASFGFNGYGITASAGANGSIAPSGSVGVVTGTSQTFTMTPAPWYGISNILVDGVSVGAVSSYSFINLMTNHTIAANFSALLAPLGTPLWWLAQYGYTNNEQALDPDGVAVWKDYLTGTNPTNPLSGPSYSIVPYAEGFENLAGWGGVYTNLAGAMGWSSGGFDRSRIVSLLYPYTATNLPLPSDTHTNVLQLNTQWGTLTNSFGSGFDMSGSLFSLDMMIPSVAVAQIPASFTVTDTGTKGGVYVNTNSQLAVYHGVAASDGTLLSNTVDAASVIVPSGAWHRVTLVIDATATNSANALAMFQVLLDGALVTHPNAYADGWKASFNTTGILPFTSPTGTWFRLATTNAVAKKLTALCFTGTGYVDDLVVTTGNPFAASAGTCLLIVTTSGNGCTSLGASPCMSVPLTSGCGTQIVYMANEWYRISALASNGVSLPSAIGARFFTQTLVNVSANVSNAVVFAMAAPAQTGYTNVPTAWLTNWTEEAVQAASGCDGFNVHDKYLLGLDPTSSNTYRLGIDALSLSGSNVVLVVKREVTGALSPVGMNGNLIIQGTPTLLTGGFTNIPSTAATGASVFDVTGRRTCTNVLDGTVKFYQAIVQ